MNRIIKITGMIMMIFVLSCEADDPMSFYGGGELVERIEEAWSVFIADDFDGSLAIFNSALIDAESIRHDDPNATLIRSTLGDIHTGIGWCNLRLLNAETAREHFIISQGYELYSFGTSVGLMTAYYELGTVFPINSTVVDSAIQIGHWILSSGMPEEFEYNQSINVDDVRLLMAKSYFSKGDLSDNDTEKAGALYWILQLDPESVYLDAADPFTWNLYDNGEQDYDSFGEAILMIILELEKDVFPA